MSIEQLIYFLKVYENKSFTKTSKELFVSQPAVTTAIKNLEKELNTQLFIKNGKDLDISESCEYFHNLVVPIVSLYNNLETQMKEFILKSTSIRIGIPPMLGSFIFAPLLNQFMNKFPKINLKLFELASNANQEALLKNEIDLALTVIFHNKIDSRLNYAKIGETKLLFAVSKNNPLASKKIISLQEIKDIPLILLKEDSLQYQVITSFFKQIGITPNIKLKTEQIATIKELLSYGKIGAFLFNQVIKENDDIVGIPLEEDFIFDIVIAYNKNKNFNKPTNDLFNFIISANLK